MTGRGDPRGPQTLTSPPGINRPVAKRWDDWGDKGFGYLHEEERAEPGKLTSEQRVRLFKLFWLIALIMTLAGFGLMILLLWGESPFG